LPKNKPLFPARKPAASEALTRILIYYHFAAREIVRASVAAANQGDLHG
jgi:hypothetical protein